MTTTEAKLLAAGVLALLAWWLTPKAAPAARVAKELEIDANVNSPTFGEVVGPDGFTDEQRANHIRLVDLVAESQEAIAAFDATHDPIPY